MSKKALWLRLHHYHFTDLVPPHLSDQVLALFQGADASTQAFASKLARKLTWSRPFALRAIGEYKKFVFLGVTSDFSVTPPKVIDQVWHEHLLFSKGYREFCRAVLRRDFDHNPELVPLSDQTDAFHAQYAETLRTYQREFNRTAPADIWGTPKFDLSLVGARPAEPVQRRRTGSADGGDGSTYTDWGADPLYSSFSSAEGDVGFGDGGGFSGGGSSGSFDGHSGHSSDSSSSDGGGGGGGSGCSSSCSGGSD